jgi:hypothetical protein
MPLMASNMAAEGGAAIGCAASNASRSVSATIRADRAHGLCEPSDALAKDDHSPSSVRRAVADGYVAAVRTHTRLERINAIDVLDSLGDQHFALVAETATILFLGSRRLDHCAHSGFAALVRQLRANQRLTVDLVSLCPPAPTGCRN